MTAAQLRADAERIWWAGVRAVTPENLIPATLQVDGDDLIVDGEPIDLRTIERLVVVGAGKASGGMAVAVEKVLGQKLLAAKRVTGWINVPADCVVPTSVIRLHAARPAGVNEPRTEGVEGTQRILELVRSCGPRDLCLCLISGGGSALLPAPVPGVTLEDKIRIAQLVSAAGGTIVDLNALRSQLSLVKGGGLARACNAGQLIALVISDVLGDPLDMIASGPTVERQSTPADALAALERLGLNGQPELAAVEEYLYRATQSPALHDTTRTSVTNLVIGNNAVAVDAAGVEAEKLGYSHAMVAATEPEGPAEDVGRHLATMAKRMREETSTGTGTGPDCLITGGEPTVKLADAAIRGRGGRNQQLVLAALQELGNGEGIALLSGGTDGEDGPTNAAGAIVTAEVIAKANRLQLDASAFLARNDAYHFFESSDGLLLTGPTQTNVCDLRVVVTSPSSE
jgi:glycerate 2-kinase